MEKQFVEPIIRLPTGRLCYQPVPWAPPDVAPSPYTNRRAITFGSFNNTAKLNPDVLDLWSAILRRVPGSRLVLKWRTLADPEYVAALRAVFARNGVGRDSVEFREASFHVDLLKAYADIDIALDPFPFTGGVTSLEALWMGVPVVTMPGSRMVSRQTYAFIEGARLGLPWAKSPAEYVALAVQLADDIASGRRDRRALRAGLARSALVDIAAHTRALEDVYFSLAARIQAGG